MIGLDDARFRAHGALPRLIGSNALALRDANGKEFIRDMLNRVKDKEQAEIDYAWRNTVTNQVETKHTFLRKVGNNLIGVGHYTN